MLVQWANIVRCVVNVKVQQVNRKTTQNNKQRNRGCVVNNHEGVWSKTKSSPTSKENQWIWSVKNRTKGAKSTDGPVRKFKRWRCNQWHWGCGNHSRPSVNILNVQKTQQAWGSSSSQIETCKGFFFSICSNHNNITLHHMATSFSPNQGPSHSLPPTRAPPPSHDRPWPASTTPATVEGRRRSHCRFFLQPSVRECFFNRIWYSKHESFSPAPRSRPRKLPNPSEPPTMPPIATRSVAGLHCAPNLSFFFSCEPHLVWKVKDKSNGGRWWRCTRVVCEKGRVKKAL